MMHLSRKSITVRTSLLFTLLAAIVFVVMGLVIRASVNHHFSEQDRSALEGKLELIRHILLTTTTPDDDVLIRRQLGDAMVGHHDLSVRVKRMAGEDVFSSGHTPIPDRILQDARPLVPRGALPLLAWMDGGVAYRALSVRISAADTPQQDWVISIAIDTRHHAEFLTAFEHELLLIGAGGLFLMASLGWLATRRGLRPVQSMARVAEGISAQRLQERLPTDDVPVELQPLARAFNEMLDRLGDSLSRLSEFSSDLAHELRTPVNNLMTQTQVSLAKPRTADEYREVMYSNLEEFERLARMIADMLFLAKADNGLIIPHRESVSLRCEVEAVIEFYEALASEKSVSLKLQGEAVTMGDPLMLRRAISNLVSNAVRHSQPNTTVNVRLVSDPQAIGLTVENTGDIIAPEQLGRVFDRFYRADASRQRSDEGAGLGLAITRSIIRAHRGEVTVSSGEARTSFHIHLPGSQEASVRPAEQN